MVNYLDFVVDSSSILNPAPDVVGALFTPGLSRFPEINIAVALGGIFNYFLREDIKRNVTERQRGGKVCIRLKFTLHGMQLAGMDVGPPDTAHYLPAKSDNGI